MIRTLLTLLVLVSGALAQDAHELVISGNGKWIASEQGGDVRVLASQGKEGYSILGAKDPRFSPDSRYVGVVKGSTLVLLDTTTGTHETYESVLSYEVSDHSSYLAYLQPKGVLQVVELQTGRIFKWHGVTEFGIREIEGNYAFVSLVTRNSAQDTLEVAAVGHAKRGWGSRGIHKAKKIEGLRWASDAVTFTFTSRDCEENSSIYTWRVPPGTVSGEFARVSPRK